ncbi:hypothetical protein IPC1150_10585 [Pseudomonas aeruginosa]|nr:hypothetical protein IPC1150_10585 [Pseudomonas aeruginosa]
MQDSWNDDGERAPRMARDGPEWYGESHSMHQAGAEEENARPHRTPSDSARRVTASGCSPYGSHTTSGRYPPTSAPPAWPPRESPAWHPVPLPPAPRRSGGSAGFPPPG